MNHDDPLLDSREVLQLRGANSLMTLWRDRRYRGFPEPIKIANRNYWRRSEVNQWIADMERQSRSPEREPDQSGPQA